LHQVHFAMSGNQTYNFSCDGHWLTHYVGFFNSDMCFFRKWRSVRSTILRRRLDPLKERLFWAQILQHCLCIFTIIK
jgi:hypothetical protein